MSKWTSFKNQGILFENWREFANEQEERPQSPEKSTQSDAAVAKQLSRAYSAGPEGVRAFMDSAEGRDPKVRQFLHKSDEGDRVSVSGIGSAPLKGITPTQKYIDLMQSVSYPLGTAESLKAAITSKKGHGPISISGEYVLDGHHRWASQYAITPDGTISATNIELPGNASQKLASLQLAIAAIDPNLNDPHPSKGGGAATNILGAGAEDIYQKIVANINEHPDTEAPGPLLNDSMMSDIVKTQDPVILQWAGLEPGQAKDPQAVRLAIAKKVAINLADLPDYAADAPDRPDMPQLDHPSIGGAKGYQKIKSRLATGDLNVVPPFAQTAESIKHRGKRIKVKRKK